MKFVYFGYDFMLPAIERLIEDGHELIGMFSFDCDNVFNFNRDCQTIAQRTGAPFILSPAEDFHIKSFLDKGAEVFIAAGYPHKIPPIDENIAYAINVHPARLPKARGLMPIPRIILDNIEDAAGFTAHKMTQNFDAGDILQQENFDLSPHETVETYTAKIAMRAPEFFSKLFNNLPALWERAKPQDEKKTTTLPPPTDQDRMFDWDKTVAEIDRVGRAFGRFGSIANFKDRKWIIYHYDCWEEKHDLEPGTIAALQSREVTIAVKDGFVCVKQFQPVENHS